MMNEIINTIWVFISGIILGTLFFGGLWFTVKKLVSSKSAALWLFASFIFRLSITLAGFYFVGAGNWQRLLVCLAGFIAARFIVLHFTKSITVEKIQIEKEVCHDTEP